LDPIDLPPQFTILFDFLCDISMPDGHAGSGYSKAAAQGNAALPHFHNWHLTLCIAHYQHRKAWLITLPNTVFLLTQLSWISALAIEANSQKLIHLFSCFL
jgi:hypothetical protein